MPPEEFDNRTLVMRNNQVKLDELEYFIDAIAVALFGEEALDVRHLRRFIPAGANLSLLIDVAQGRRGSDLASDFQFVADDLSGPGAAATDPGRLFDFRPYLALRARTPRLLEQLEERFRGPIEELLARDRDAVETALARVHAYAWLELVGLPDLAIELDPIAEKVARLQPDESLTRTGLEAMAQALPDGNGPVLAPLLARVHYLLSLEYRDQLRGLLESAP